MKYYFVVVEGAHDEAILAKMLKIMGFKERTDISEIDPFWQGLVPKNFPYRNRINERVPVPSIFSKGNQSVSIYSVGGQDQLVPSISLSLSNTIDANKLSGLAIICDADELPPLTKFSHLKNALIQEEELWLKEQFSTVKRPGELFGKKPAMGIFILPNNEEQGTLETLLVEGAQTSYPKIHQGATSYLNKLPSEYTDSWNASKKGKALVGIIGNVILPGRSNQVVIKDRKSMLITEHTIERTSQRHLYKFITQLLA